MDKFLMY